MFASFSDPFEALLALQRALDSRISSDWIGRGTATIGSFPPINMFQKGDDLVAVVELPGVSQIHRNSRSSRSARSTRRPRAQRPVGYSCQ
jgi:hypothetical protein